MPVLEEAVEMSSKLGTKIAEAVRECPALAVAEKLGDSFRSAERALKHAAQEARYSTEELADDTRHTIRHHPFTSVLAGFGAGVLVGCAVVFAATRQRR